MATQRAPKGGARGANGEWYEGGKFINSIPENAKREGSAPKRKTGKCEIEPYTWVVTDRRPIYRSLAGTAGKYDHDSKTFAPFMPLFDNAAKTWAYTGMTLIECQALCDAYNSGKRYFDEL